MRLRGIVSILLAGALLAAGTGVAAGQEQLLYSFTFNTVGTDGAAPTGNLVFDTNGNLYGATSSGGSTSDAGMIFELSPKAGGGWTEKIIYAFTGEADGGAPTGSLIFDSNGNLYGTAGNGQGVVFELSPQGGGVWTEQVLYTFKGSTDGSGPQAGLIFDKNGNLYGTTISGGANFAYGTVFELSPQQGGVWTEQILHSFNNNFVDGYRPLSSLVLDATGNLYGTTSYGGANAEGTVFELTPGPGGVWTEKILYSQSYANTPYADLIFDAEGDLYSTSFAGGVSGGGALNGTVFELTPQMNGTWTEQILHSFAQDATDGGSPAAGLIFDTKGNLYSTTFHGGPNYTQVSANTDGTVFELLPQPSGGWAEQVLYFFGTATNDGVLPAGGVISDGNGNLYGVTGEGGASGYGAVYEYSPVPTTPMPVFELASGIYSPPQSVSIMDTDTSAAIYYTTDGSLPTSSSNLYGGAIPVSVTETIRAIAVHAGFADSPVAYATYVIEATTAAPVFTPPGGSYSTAQMVSFTEGTAGAMIYYSTNGSAPTTLLTGPIPVSTTETIQAFAVLSGDLPSAIVSATYTLPPQTVAPVFSPGTGTYGPGQAVTLNDATPGAVIYYTTTGAPTTSSTVYSGAITLTASEIIRSIAKAPGDLQSSIAVASYTITAGAKTTPTVVVTPSATSITTAQPLTVTVTVIGVSGSPTPTGTVTLTSGSYASASTTLSSGSAVIVIPAGSLPVGTDTLAVVYTPDTASSSTYNSASGSSSVTVTASAAAVTLSATSLSFGNEPVGATGTLPVTLTNTGTASLSVSAIGNSGVNPTDFSHTSNCGGVTIAPSGSCTIQVKFTPAATGAFSATLNITDNAGNSPQSIALTGTGTNPPVVTLSATSLGFPSTQVGKTSILPVTLTNTGLGNLSVTAIGNTGANPTDFSHTSNCGGITIAPSGSCTIQVMFAPAAAGSFSATLNITDNATNSPQSITLTGTGTNGAVVTLSATSLSFPSTQVGSTATLPVTVTNTGLGNLSVTAIGNTGANPTDFSHTSNCGGVTIAPNGTCTIQVKFIPLAAGSLSATLNITDNATNSPQLITLTGTGTNAAAVTLSATTLAFPSTVVGATSTIPVTLTNTGQGNLSVTAIGNTGANPTDFGHTSNCGGVTIAPNGTCTIHVNFTPAAAGSFAATLNITDNAAGSPQGIVLSGTGTNPPAVSLSASTLNFPTTTVGSTATLPVTLTNTGTGNLTVSAIGNSGTNPTDFSHTSNCGGVTIAPNGTCTIQVKFTPSAAGAFSATLNITDNAPGSPQGISLSGTGQ